MANEQDKNKEKADQEKNIQQREAFNNAYAALQGQQSVQTFNAFTLEEALDAQIERIEGKGTTLRPSQLVRVEKIRGNVLKAIEEIRLVDPSEFIPPNKDEDVNTLPDEK